MSLKSWRAEFYQLAAKKIKDPIQAIDHSLLKWTGLREENLKKHGVRLRYFDVKVPGQKIKLSVDADTCALCNVDLIARKNDTTYRGRCFACPIMLLTRKTCFEEYDKAIWDKDVEPMISLLEKVRRWYES